DPRHRQPPRAGAPHPPRRPGRRPAPVMRRAPGLATWIALGIAVALHVYLQYGFLHDFAHDFDAIHLYQPLAQGLMREGPGFFLQEASLQAPPVTYVYQALLGASLPAVRWANLVLSILSQCLVFRAAWLLHSRIAGLAAAFLFAVCPLLREFIVAPLSEGP